MKSIHRPFSRFDIVSAMALILLFSSGATLRHSGA
jgi:hypothetical protein